MTKEFTLDDLNRAADLNKQRRKQRYQLARELGFSANDATTLQGHTEESIRKLAQEKNKQEGENGRT